MSEVMAIGPWRNNAELIADMPRLGYLHEDWLTLDPTYGQGKFWTRWRPTSLVTSDIDRGTAAHCYYDFTVLPPEWTDTYDAVVFDPPYKLNGTSTGKGSSAMDVGYGVGGDYWPWQRRHNQIKLGIAECARTLKTKGYLLIKCMDQVCSGAVRWQTFEFANTAHIEGCPLVDMFHIQSWRPQPEGRRQLHARRNYSTLLVCRKS